jgi:phosphatidylserine/phosphatidylglycerophosphate/cardiolipin synthase-like enzyme
LKIILLALAAVHPTLEPHFSPNGGCTAAVVRELGNATSRVRVLAYSFTSAPIADALEAARARGVDVSVVLDAGQATDPHSLGGRLSAAGIPVRYDHAHAIAHNKTMVIDQQIVITGSFNFTAAAELHNAENLLVIRDPAAAAAYGADWVRHQSHARPPGPTPTVAK